MDKNRILKRTFSKEFIELMKNRIIVSFAKYGDLKKTKQNVLTVRDELKNAEFRIRKYKKTGNPEYLVDAANFLMFEFMEMRGNFIAVDNDLEDRIV